MSVVRSTAFSLNRLVPNEGSHAGRMRVGRGMGSGKGKQCGRGGKGQTARVGRSKPRIGFEGGQTPLFKRVGKFGFDNPTRLEYVPVNLGDIKVAISRGRLDDTKPINQYTLAQAGLIAKNTQWPGVKLLADGHEWFDRPIQITIPRASTKAIEVVQKTGGNVQVEYAARQAMRQLMQEGEITGAQGTPVPSMQQYYAGVQASKSA
ncbi:mitochondrial ribosomal protein L15 (uL15m) [Andalucia godoyi]|uniref:Mitochondrial ribosomal protein L15 (UL15m) n=1 Tax=Andalucia godoyi TaxID=505711 RepID=A0A8K0F179_ANDGO|nr:mitochondrial ribosomal protein L15 (uL15m) [Andalucia godoyi]|eukprot:ANDGO_03729.mRNA.1 mitochondrial ribosomal protein L15 (uL15m)